MLGDNQDIIDKLKENKINNKTKLRSVIRP